MSSPTQEKILELIKSDKVVLFMKGTPERPECGFSAQTVSCLKEAGVSKLTSVNILQDNAIREGIKIYSNWPTIPQVYLNGEFIGGCDIITQMHANGELKTAIQKACDKERSHG